MNYDRNNGPWGAIGWFVIGAFIGQELKRHWRFLAVCLLAFLAYQYMVMAYHYLARVL